MEFEMFDHEEWRDIPGYEGLYEASDLGRIRSLHKLRVRGSRDGILKASKDKGGYLRVSLRKDGEDKNRYVHNLILEAFVGANPGMECNHKDGETSNNCLSNLEYCTRRENSIHAYRFLNRKPNIQRGGANGKAKLTADDVREIKRLHASGLYSHREIAEMFPVGARNVGDVLAGKLWKHVI